MDHALVARYDVPGPRYTSYPTVPYWDQDSFEPDRWRERLRRAAERSGEVGVYVHLPYCERLCTFCGCTKRISRSHAVERPYVDGVLAEWALYAELLGGPPPVSELHLGGGTPTFFSPRHLAMLVEGILAGGGAAPDAELAFEAHPTSTTPAHLSTLHELGVRRLSLGIQDFDPVVQHAIRRVQDVAHVRAVTDEARRLGYASINFDLVYGLPKQTRGGLTATVHEVIAMRPDRIAFYGYAHVPWIKGVGSRGFDEADIPSGAAKRALYEEGRGLLEEAGYVEIGLDHFALPDDALSRALAQGTLHRNFMGYTARAVPVVVGLGMSAIGDTGDAFAQNEKKVDDWAARVERGELPVFRGHLLDAEDRMLRRHITDVMCRLGTRFTPGEASRPAIRAALARLAQPEADGLVRRRADGVDVLPAGRPFLRNVCMAFDARLWRDVPSTRIFSQAV